MTYRRETNTMPQWAGSCWYYLRYIDPHNAQAFADPAKLNHWLPVDLYVGGAEHAVLHLLYSADSGTRCCSTAATCNVRRSRSSKLVNQGMILGEYEYHVTPVAIEVRTRRRWRHQGVEGVLREAALTTIKAMTPTSPMPFSVEADLCHLNLPEDMIEKKKGKTVDQGHRHRS